MVSTQVIEAPGAVIHQGGPARISGSSRQVSAEIDEAVALASSVVDQQSAAREHEASTLDGMVQRQRALIGEYEALKRSYEAALGEIDASSRALSSAISDALAQIQFQDIVRQRLEHLIRGVEAISGDGASWAAAVEVLASAYKMSAERVVHESVTGEALGGHETSRKIELF